MKILGLDFGTERAYSCLTLRRVFNISRAGYLVETHTQSICCAAVAGHLTWHLRYMPVRCMPLYAWHLSDRWSEMWSAKV